MIVAQWQLDPILIGGILTLALCYGLAVGPLRHRLAPGRSLPRRQIGLFSSGLILLYLAEGSPLHDYAERYLLSAHMFQHLLISYLVPVLWLLGTPDWVLRPLLTHRWVKPVAKTLTQPVVAFLLFSLLFSIWHLPVLYEPALRNSLVHHSEHVVLIAISLLMWWPLLSPLPELPRLSYGGQLVYLFLLPIIQIIAFAFITFADHVIYAPYAAAPRVLGLSPLQDQAIAGAIMKIGGIIAFGTAFIVVFFRWYQNEVGSRYKPKSTKLPAES
ncbi:MAG: cytochrome c oxidase assembly protein [Trueperaceae bacterium]|nr:cytochrome c oxidase assembly protein [Trueperaceae bacterium]